MNKPEISLKLRITGHSHALMLYAEFDELNKYQLYCSHRQKPIKQRRAKYESRSMCKTDNRTSDKRL